MASQDSTATEHTIGGWLTAAQACVVSGLSKNGLVYLRMAKKIRARRDTRTGWFLYHMADLEALAQERAEARSSTEQAMADAEEE